MSQTLGELAVKFGCELIGDPDTQSSAISTLSSASAGDIAFFANKKYKSELLSTKASAVIITKESIDDCAAQKLISSNPYATYARIAQLFHPARKSKPGIHPSAVIMSMGLPDEISIGPNVVIEENVVLGAGVSISANSYIGSDVNIGANTNIAANVSIQNGVQIGADCYIHSGVVIGSDGFGHAPDVDGYVKIPQIGTVIIGDKVEIGANTTIDRGSMQNTVIENGVKLDNLIQIAHNVHIGEHTVIAACTGVSGSTRIGKRCMIGGQVGFVGHLEVCDDVIINGRTMVSGSITEKGRYAGGFPMDDAKNWMRNVAQFRRLSTLAKRVKELEKHQK